MTAAQLTFWISEAVLSIGLFTAFYPGVRRQAASARDSALASAMAATLCATTAALVMAFMVNAAVTVYHHSL